MQAEREGNFSLTKAPFDNQTTSHLFVDAQRPLGAQPGVVLCAKVWRARILRRHGEVSFHLGQRSHTELFPQVKESSFIRNMHKELFFCPPRAAEIWQELFVQAVNDVFSDEPRKDEIIAVLVNWTKIFGKTVINASDDDIATYKHRSEK